MLSWDEILEVKMHDPDNYFKKFNIKISDLIEYLNVLSEKTDPINTLLLFGENNFNKILELENVEKYTTSLSQKQIDSDIVELSKNNINKLFSIIHKKVLENGIPYAVVLIKIYLQDFEEFDLKFNIIIWKQTKQLEKYLKVLKNFL
jgi:hypothetical protein